jgi:hypothetical protein
MHDLRIPLATLLALALIPSTFGSVNSQHPSKSFTFIYPKTPVKSGQEAMLGWSYNGPHPARIMNLTESLKLPDGKIEPNSGVLNICTILNTTTGPSIIGSYFVNSPGTSVSFLF